MSPDFGGLSVMKRDLLSFFFLAVTASIPLYADPAYPFLDQNRIIDIKAKGNEVIFKTINGKKSYDIKKNTWSYNPCLTPFPTPDISSEQKTNDGGQYPDPSEYGFQHSPINQVNESNWKLEVLGNEEGFASYNFINKINKKEFMLPDLYYLQYLVFHNQAWFTYKSSYLSIIKSGILCLDLKTGKMTYYETQPVFPMKYVQVGGHLYFLNNYGLFFLDRNKIQSTSINSPKESTEYRDMFADGDKIYVLDCPWDETPYKGTPGKPLLLVYETGN
jgi:hypothetical protein